MGKAVKVSNRVIAYYESDGAQPPGALLAELAKVLRVSADELLGLKPVRDDTPPRTARLLNACAESSNSPQRISAPS
jgi:transcriptional regulator with XRE-family HTH domain